MCEFYSVSSEKNKYDIVTWEHIDDIGQPQRLFGHGCISNAFFQVKFSNVLAAKRNANQGFKNLPRWL